MDPLPRSFRHCGILLAVVVLLAGAAAGPADAAETTHPARLVAVYNCNYHPVSFRDERTGKPEGFFIDLMDGVTARAGLTVTYTCRNSWPEMISAIEDGDADVGALLKSSAREKSLSFSSPIEMTYLSYFIRAQSRTDARRVPSGYSVGVIHGSMSEEQLRKLPGVELRRVDSYPEGIFSLLAGEFDVFAGEEARVLMHAREAGIEDRIRKIGQPFLERERGLAVRKDDQELLAVLNRALAGYVGGEDYRRSYLKWYGRPAPSWTIARIAVAGGTVLFVVVCAMAIWRYRSIHRLNRSLVSTMGERERAEEALWQSRNMLSKVLNTMPQSVFWKDRDSVYLGCNDVFARAVGLDDAGSIAGKTDFDLPWPREEAESYRSDDREVIETNRPKHHIIEPLQQADGSRLWIDTSKVPLADREGKVFGVLGVYEDISERKRNEERVRKNEQFIRGILDTVDEGFIVIDRDYRIVAANKAYCTQAGLPSHEVIGSHCFSVSHKTARPCYEEGEDCAVRHVFATGAPHTASHVHRSGDGQLIYVETKAFPLRDAQGNVTAAIETVNNITEKHLLEEERLKTQKLESIGTLAGGIAHDFNNLLQGVFGFISLAKLVAGDKEQTIASLDDAERALHLTVKLTNQLLTFSKGGTPVLHPTDLRPVIENAVSFSLSGSRTGSRLRIHEDLWYARADDGQIAQVVQNIVLNADQAMPSGGTVEVAVRNVVAPGEGVPQRLHDGRYVEIAIRDTGVGIPANHLTRIFDPYFTTKEKGSGLGLATSYSIVRNHGGTIEVRSEMGKGATFLIYVPAAEAATEQDAPAAAPDAARKGRILLMDDEEMVRNATSALLTGLGHDVEAVRDGEEAVLKYRDALDAGRPFDVVILDWTVRGAMGGSEAAQKLRALDGSVNLVVSSGYADDAVITEYREHGFRAFLKKPYDLASLRAVMNELLA